MFLIKYSKKLDVRNSDSVFIFNHKLNSDIYAIQRYFHACNRRIQVLHTRLRTKCSSLKNDPFQKHITGSSLCLCGNVENTDHYFMRCRLYREQRAELDHKISKYASVIFQNLLFGSHLLSLPTTSLIFEAVHEYITDTKHV